MSRPHLDSHTGFYCIRRRVPDALRQVLGIAEFKRSLETKDTAEADGEFEEDPDADSDAPPTTDKNHPDSENGNETPVPGENAATE